jgi:hypothetical protein
MGRYHRLTGFADARRESLVSTLRYEGQTATGTKRLAGILSKHFHFEDPYGH